MAASRHLGAQLPVAGVALTELTSKSFFSPRRLPRLAQHSGLALLSLPSVGEDAAKRALPGKPANSVGRLHRTQASPTAILPSKRQRESRVQG